MKTNILSIFSALAVMLGFAACDDHSYGPEMTDEGKLSFASFGVEVESTETEIESRASAVDVSGYTVKIINDKDVTVDSYTYSALPEVLTLPIGTYTVKVESHEVQKAEFDNPYYAGSKTVTIKTNAVADAGTITCRFASIRVSIKYADSLKPLLGDDVTVRVRANDDGELTFTADETRSGYFEAVEGSTTLVAIFEGTVNGAEQWLRKELTDVEAGQHRIITFKIKGMPDPPAETGTIDPSTGITIDADVTLVDQDGNVTVDEDVLSGDDRPGQEEPETPDDPDDPDDPTPPATDESDVTMTSDLTFDTPLAFDTTTGKGKVSIHADSGLAHIYLEITSTHDDFAGLIKDMFGEGQFDLAYPSSDESKESLRQLGLKYGEDVINKTDVEYDISSFIGLLGTFSGEHEFKFTAISNDDNEAGRKGVAKSLIITVK